MAATGDPWHDLWAPLGAIAAVALIAISWYLGWIGELTTSLILGSTAAVAAFVLPLVAAELSLPGTAQRVAAAAVALGSLAVFAVVLGSQLFPGKPVASLSFDQQVREQSFTLEHPGELRLVLHTDMAHEPGSRVAWRLALQAGTERALAEGAFSRSGSGGKGAVSAVHGTLATLVTLATPGPVTVKLGSWESKRGTLYVDVYPNRCPHRALLVVQLGLLAVALATRRRLGRVKARVLLVHGALFGVLVTATLPGALTPAEPVMPLFGTLVLSAVGGALGGELLGWLALRGKPKVTP